VHVQNDDGSVFVTGWDRNEVSVRARGGDSRSFRLSGDEERIRVRTDESVDLEVRVPRRARGSPYAERQHKRDRLRGSVDLSQ
jgi:hypothetical protein